jgi:hypothetical protein
MQISSGSSRGITEAGSREKALIFMNFMNFMKFMNFMIFFWFSSFNS